VKVGEDVENKQQPMLISESTLLLSHPAKMYTYLKAKFVFANIKVVSKNELLNFEHETMV